MPDPATRPTTGAVFLSYAREDTEAARRIADALRSFGVEVWFDQNDLRGGDAWDQKIRKQIRECALFVPVISQHTQARGEGYFRLEWKLAVERTHLMAEGLPFLAPVAIDDAHEADAVVPPEFMRVQWTRLARGVPTSLFVDQIKHLVEAPRRATTAREATRPPPAPIANSGMTPPNPSPAPRVGRHIPAAAWITAAAALVVVAFIVVQWLRHPAAESPARLRPEAAATPGKPAASDAKPALDTASAKSIAVLPFANFSPDKDNEFFADGMHDEVITALAKIHDLTVISRTSVMAYKKAEGRNLKRIAAELGVASVLEGSVQRAGNQVKVIVQLIDARTDQHLWAETYVESLTDVFTIQSKLAGAITSALKATLSPAEKSRIARRPTQNQEAYDLYLRARALSETIGAGASQEAYERVIALYAQAVAQDPAFALAHVQLCYFNGVMYWFGAMDPTPARRARAKAALDAALRHAPDLAETRLALGAYSYLCENDWARALVEFRAAEAGLPNDAQLLYLIGIAQRRLGRLAEALDSFARSVELNPRDFTVPPQQLVSLRAMHRFSALRDLATHYLARFPDNGNLQGHVAVARLELDHDRAAYWRRLEAIPPSPSDAHGLIKAYRLALARGDLDAAARALADPRLVSVPGTGGIVNDPVALHRAGIALLRGQRDEARALADEALAAYRVQTWSPRQEPWAMIGTALAHAVAGRGDEAVRLGREAAALAAARDAFNAGDARHALARIYLVLDRRDDALGCLREMMTMPCDAGPETLRLDPQWSRLKDDPRFEEILKSARPL